MIHHDEDIRAVLEWVAANPPPFEPRGVVSQAIWDFLTVIAWAFWGVVSVTVVFSPFMFLWFLVFFE